MDQAELRDLLLTLAAQAGAEYEKVLIDRNSKFEEITLISHRLEALKIESEDSVFSPRNKLSSYDAKITLEDEYKKEKLELARLDNLLDSMLNRKEELIEGVELLDSILEERDELTKKVSEFEEKEIEFVSSENESESDVEFSDEKNNIPKSDDKYIVENKSDFIEEDDDVEDLFVPDVKQVMDALSQVAYQCGEIANYTIQDPYRARNELRAISVKYGN